MPHRPTTRYGLSSSAFVVIGDINEKQGIEVAKELRRVSGSRLWVLQVFRRCVPPARG
jgi:hypothetical protein